MPPPQSISILYHFNVLLYSFVIALAAPETVIGITTSAIADTVGYLAGSFALLSCGGMIVLWKRRILPKDRILHGPHPVPPCSFDSLRQPLVHLMNSIVAIAVFTSISNTFECGKKSFSDYQANCILLSVSTLFCWLLFFVFIFSSALIFEIMRRNNLFDPRPTEVAQPNPVHISLPVPAYHPGELDRHGTLQPHTNIYGTHRSVTVRKPVDDDDATIPPAVFRISVNVRAYEKAYQQQLYTRPPDDVARAVDM
ncbi:hypothetical protein FISHEDRAFT_62292 [Fistulina hepatica ATCC 64428]|nr:hypothetical protein FISHEDRAFT_62292 [Fistulina hepatica ATCC 64428]